MKRHVVLITGCSAGGLGHALAHRFHKAGALVFASARSEGAMGSLDAGIARICLEVTDEQQCEQAVERVVQEAGRVDILVNNAGVALPGPIAEVPLSNLRQSVATNLVAPVCMIQKVLPHMARQGGGIVINISSIYGHVMCPFNGTYSATKHALRCVSNTLRLELAPYNVSVMDVALGFTATSMLSKGTGIMASAKPDPRISRAHAAAGRAQASIVARAAPVEKMAEAIVSLAMRRGGPPHSLMIGTGAWLAWAGSCVPVWAVQLVYGVALGLLPWRLPWPLSVLSGGRRCAPAGLE